MGAWGTGVFEDDTACDLLYEAMEADAKSFIVRAIDHKNLDYLDYDQCYEVIISAVILDSILNGTKYKHEINGYEEWLTQQNQASIEIFRTEIVSDLKVVLSDKSELKKLWSENKDDYLTWKAEIENIIVGLSSGVDKLL